MPLSFRLCYALAMLPEVFLKYAKIYQEHGFSLYMVGGSSRDFLLGIPFTDFDFATDATPEEEKAFVPQASYSFSKYGSISFHEGPLEIDITTLREEGDYDDRRHPKTIRFIKDLEKDSIRRDFTINAIYINHERRVFDFHRGKEDLEAGLIRFIGDPIKRIQEDPLRILRAERFAKKLGFRIEEETRKAIEENRHLLDLLNPEKIKMERKKEGK